MSVNSTKLKQSGFTIVELLIVIVVIGILAAITIVAFNGVQNRGKTAAAQSLADTVKKKAEAYNALNSTYPANVAAFDTGTGATDETKLGTAEAAKVSTATIVAPTAASSPIASYVACGTSPNFTGATVAYWKYGTGGGAQSVTLGTC